MKDKKEVHSRNNKEIAREINNQKGALPSGAHTQDVGDLASVPQLEVPGKLHNGRPLPPVETAKDAEVKSGVAKRCADQQVGENRLPINSYEADCKSQGSNN